MNRHHYSDTVLFVRPLMEVLKRLLPCQKGDLSEACLQKKQRRQSASLKYPWHPLASIFALSPFSIVKTAIQLLQS